MTSFVLGSVLPTAALRQRCSSPALEIELTRKERLHHTLEVLTERCLQVQGHAGDRVGQTQLCGGEHQAALAEAFGEVVVVPGAAVIGVADDGVGDVLHMPTQLVLAAGERVQGHKAVAAGGKAFDLYRQLRGSQAGVASLGIAQGLGLVLEALVHSVLAQGVVDQPVFRGPAPHHGLIGLVHGVGHHGLAEQTGGVRVAGEQQQTRCRPVQTMRRVDVFATVQLAGVLQGKFGFVPVDGAAVHQQTGRLVHGQQPVVPVQLGQRICVRQAHR